MTPVFVCLFCLKKVLCKRIPHEDSSIHVNRSLVFEFKSLYIVPCAMAQKYFGGII